MPCVTDTLADTYGNSKMKIGISALSKLDVVQYPNEKIYIPLDQVFETINQQRKSHETITRKDNFKRACGSHLIKHNDIPHVELGGVIGYCYANRQKQTFCAQVCTQVEHKLYQSGKNNEPVETVLGLYKDVADFNFHSVSKLSN